MSADDLTIKMKLDRSQAKQAVKDHGDDLDAMKAKLGGAQQGIVGLDGKVRAANGRFLTMGKEGAGALDMISKASITTGLNLSKLAQIANGVREAMKAAAESNKELASDFNADADKLRELSTLLGVKNDNAFVVGHAQWNRQALMNKGEGLSFRKAYQDSGAQFAGVTMSKDESSRFELLSARLATAKGINPEDVGKFAGTVAGLRKYKDADEALNVTNSSMSILQSGSGDAAHLVKENQRLNAAILKEDAMAGLTQDPRETSTLISTAAEFAPNQEFESVRAGLLALRDFKGKSADILKRAKITPQDTPIAQLRKLKPVVDQMAIDQHVKPFDILKDNFEDRTGAAGIAGLMDKGIGAGIFDMRMAKADEGGPTAAMDFIKDFETSDRGADRAAISENELSTTERGAENSKIDTLRKIAIAQLVREKAIDSTRGNVKEFLGGMIPFGDVGSKGRVIDDRVLENLYGTGPEKFKKTRPVVERLSDVSEERESFLNKRIDQAIQAGGNPLIDALNANTKATLDLKEHMEKQNGGNVPPLLRSAPTTIRRP